MKIHRKFKQIKFYDTTFAWCLTEGKEHSVYFPSVRLVAEGVGADVGFA